MTDGLERYREVKKLEKHIESMQLQLASMQRELGIVLNKMAGDYVKEESPND